MQFLNSATSFRWMQAVIVLVPGGTARTEEMGPRNTRKNSRREFQSGNPQVTRRTIPRHRNPRAHCGLAIGRPRTIFHISFVTSVTSV